MPRKIGGMNVERQGILYDNYPTRKRMTVLIPLISGGLMTVGALGLSVANGMPAIGIVPNALGWGFVTAAHCFWIASHAIHNERTAYWQYRAKLVELDIVKHPEKYAEEEPEPEPEPQKPPGFYIENGQAILRVPATGKNKRKGEKPSFEAEVTQYIGSIVVQEPGQGETYTVVDVEFGLWMFAQHDAASRPTNEREWSPVGPGRPFSQREYRLVRDALIEDHLAYWKNPRSTKPGWEFTHRARAIMRGLKGTTPPTQKRGVAVDEKNAESRTYARAHERG